MPTLSQIILILTQYKYFVLLPIAIIEGPIISVIGGFLISIHVLNFLLTYCILIVGDIVGDTVYYSIGRYGGDKFTKRWGKYIGINEQSLVKAESILKQHGSKLYIFGKVQGLGSVILMAAGATKMPYPKFIWINTLITLVKTFILVLIGYYFGYAYAAIDNYLTKITIISTFIIIVAVVAYIFNNHKNYENSNRY